MENASKALIIAGAILLSILLISLGIMVYNNAKGTISDANLDQETAQAFNTKISQYCGTDKSGTTMNSLMDTISTLNGSQKGKSTKHYIEVSYDGTTYGCASDGTVKENGAYPTFDNSSKYTATYKVTNGYVSLVTITN